MYKVKMVDGNEYAMREVTITQTTRFLWSVVDILEASAKESDILTLRISVPQLRERQETRSRQLREMAGEIKRQLVDDINKEILKSSRE